MDDLTRSILTVVTIVLAVGAPVWSVWMIRRHWIKYDPAVKHRQTETLMMRPIIFGVIGPVYMPIIGLAVLYLLKRGTCSLKGALLALGIGLVITVFFVCFGTRQVLIYDYDRLRYRPAFGRMRTYNFSEIRSMTPIVFDLLVHTGKRWILIDAQQDWHPLWNNYRSYKKRMGLPIKNHEYKTAVGRAFGAIPGGIGFFVGVTFILVGGGAFFLFAAWNSWRAGLIGVAIGFVLFAVFGFTGYVLVLVASTNREKHPRFTKIMVPRLFPDNDFQLSDTGKPKKNNNKTEKKSELLNDHQDDNPRLR